MNVLIVERGKPAYPAEIDGSLKSMQAIVGGLIQAVYPWQDTVALVCNDEAKLIGLPLNRAIDDYDIIAGTFFVCGLDGGDFASLSEQQLKTYTTMFESPEWFVHTPEGLLCMRSYRGPDPKAAKAGRPPQAKKPKTSEL